MHTHTKVTLNSSLKIIYNQQPCIRIIYVLLPSPRLLQLTACFSERSPTTIFSLTHTDLDSMQLQVLLQHLLYLNSTQESALNTPQSFFSGTLCVFGVCSGFWNRYSISLHILKGNQSCQQEGYPSVKHYFKKLCPNVHKSIEKRI